MSEWSTVERAREALVQGLGRRGFLRAAAGVGVLSAASATTASSAAARGRADLPTRTLQPHRGRIDGDHYLPSTADAAGRHRRAVHRRPTLYGNVSVFTPVRRRHGLSIGVMPVAAGGSVAFPLNPFMGLMGVAFADGTLTAPELNSIPPTLGGGNIDISLLGLGSAFYLPVFAEGALFHVGDPHLAMGDGEVALTAMEGSLRATFRLTVCKPGSATRRPSPSATPSPRRRTRGCRSGSATPTASRTRRSTT